MATEEEVWEILHDIEFRDPKPMRVNVNYSVDVTEQDRTLINQFYGKAGMADRAHVRLWLERYGRLALDYSPNGEWRG